MKAILASLLAAVILCAGSPAVVFAQDGSQTIPLARRLFDEGFEAAHKSQWPVALDRFARSYELAARPKTLFNLAGAQMNTGNLVAASESYRRFLRDTNDGRYPELRQDATAALVELEKTIPFVTIRVIGVSPGDKIVLDDSEFPQAGLGESMPTDPGAHGVEVERDGKKIGSRKFNIGAGDAKRIDIVVEPRAEVESAEGSMGGGNGEGPRGADLTGSPTRPAEEDSGSILSSGWFWTAVAVVAVGGAGAGYYFTRDLEADPTLGTLGRGVVDVAP